MERDKFKKGIEDIKNIKLPVNKKAVVLARLNSYIKENPVSINIPVKSSWYNKIEVFAFSKFSYITATFLIFSLFGISAFYEAEQSLPGDNLYSLKVDVIEPLKYTMTVGTVAKANIQSENLASRLLEAEILASQGKLTDSKGEEIESRLKKHVSTFNSLISATESATSSSNGVLNATVDFEAKVNAHTRILEKMEENIKNKSENKNVSKIKDILKSTIIQNMIVSTTTNKKSFETKKKETESVIEKTRKNIEKNRGGKSKVNMQILEESNKSLLEAESALIRAKQNEISGDKEKAFSDLIDSRKSAKEADVSLEASSHIEDEDSD